MMPGPRKRQNRRRRGTATVELAVCLPALVFIAMAAIQASDTLFLKQTLHVSAYETVRVAIQPHATKTEALAAGQQILDDRNVVNSTIATDPEDLSTVTRGQPILVTVSAPCNGNTVIPQWLYDGETTLATVKMVKE